MDGFVDDFGSAHPQTKQARVLVTGLPKGPPGILLPVETSEISDTRDTYDTKDGEAHPAGPASASKDFTLSLYASDLAGNEFMQYWYGLNSSPLGKATVTVEYPYPDGSKGMARQLTRALCVGRSESGTGSPGGAMVTWTIKYKAAKPV